MSELLTPDEQQELQKEWKAMSRLRKNAILTEIMQSRESEQIESADHIHSDALAWRFAKYLACMHGIYMSVKLFNWDSCTGFHVGVIYRDDVDGTEDEEDMWEYTTPYYREEDMGRPELICMMGWVAWRAKTGGEG